MVLIFSGSETYKLDEIFGHLPVWLAAENGVLVRPPARQGQPRPVSVITCIILTGILSH